VRQENLAAKERIDKGHVLSILPSFSSEKVFNFKFKI